MSERVIAIQRNPRSGAGPRATVIRELISTLKHHGFCPRLFSRREKLDAWVAVPENRAKLYGLVAAGGDGTFRGVINRFSGIPLAVLPLGTENLVARYLGVPRSGVAVANMIASGKLWEMDLCDAGGARQKFALMASAGFDGEIVHRTDARRRGHITRLTYAIPILMSLLRYRYPLMKVFLDDDPTPVTGTLVAAMNLPVYALKLRVADEALGDDGWLDVRIFQKGSTFPLLRYVWYLFRGGVERLPDVVSRKARRIRIESEESIPMQIDGDPGGMTPAEIRLLPRAVTVFVPEERWRTLREKVVGE